MTDFLPAFPELLRNTLNILEQLKMRLKVGELKYPMTRQGTQGSDAES